jgi:TRAP-type C4-dicarboxylate transport system permease small subunit
MQDFKLDGGGDPGPSGIVDRTLSVVEDGLVIVAGFIVIALMIVVTADVIMRSAFNYPLPNSYEYMELGLVFIVYLGAAQVQREKRHIAIDAVIKMLPPRGGALAEMFGCIVGLILMAGIGWWGAQAAWNSFETAEYIGSVARVPVLPARIALLCGVLVLSIRLLIDIWRYGCRVVNPRGPTPVMEGHV